MSTTKLDLLRDILHEALIDLDFNFDLSDDGDADEKQMDYTRESIVEDMLSNLKEFDKRADNSDFTVRVEMDKPTRYTGLEMFPGIKESLDKLTIRKK